MPHIIKCESEELIELCDVCSHQIHKVSEVVDGKVKYYCPNCDENYWVSENHKFLTALRCHFQPSPKK